MTRIDTCDDERWEPDDALVESAAQGARAMSELSAEDRSWVVAGLTARGLTAEETADRLACSLRLVRSIRAQPMTRVATFALTETHAFDSEMRLARVEQQRLTRELDTSKCQYKQARDQLSRLLDAHLVGHVDVCRNGHPYDYGNTYHAPSGKRHCRQCASDRQRNWRQRNRNDDGVTLSDVEPCTTTVSDAVEHASRV